MFPGRRDVVGHDAGVDEEKQDVTYGVEGVLQEADAEAVRTASRRVSHTENDAM